VLAARVLGDKPGLGQPWALGGGAMRRREFISILGSAGAVAAWVWRRWELEMMKRGCALCSIVIASAVVAFGASSSAKASETWTCTYPGFGANKRPVTIAFSAKENKLFEGDFLTPSYDLVEDNQYSLIGVKHYSKCDELKGSVRIFSATVIIERTFGHFIYMIAEIGDDAPGYRTGNCAKD
jgi:hypothetical protein